LYFLAKQSVKSTIFKGFFTKKVLKEMQGVNDFFLEKHVGLEYFTCRKTGKMLFLSALTQNRPGGFYRWALFKNQ